ncbi:DEAD/DEAH box helicase family protein [bacterium]|nr:DEAD/DEAH box helicase family protein [bacterium]
MDNYKNISFIQKILFSLSNIKTLIPYENKDNESFITKINGLPGSGKTVFAFLLFCTESKCILIVSNKKFFNEYKQSCIKIEKDKSNKFTLINENFISNVEDELSDYKFVIIDESQNIENEVLLMICKFCFDNKKKLYLLSDFNQNIYA